MNSHSCTVKPALYAKKGAWTSIRVIDLLKWLDKQKPTDIESGHVNLYVSNQVRDESGKIGYFNYLDIESTDHDDIDANIQAARDAYIWLHERGLTEGIEIVLSGRGCRFCWPFMIPHDHAAAFRDMVREIPNAEAVNDKGFMRVIGYRGCSRQGKARFIDAHLHLIENPADILTMTAASYKTLVSGKTTKDAARRTLEKIIPSKNIPHGWTTALDHYRTLRKIKNCIIQPPKPGYSGNYFPQIFAALDDKGISYREIKDGIIKLSECLFCGRKDTNAYVTPRGRAKCWSAGCEAGQRDETGRITGRLPSEWIDGFIEPAPELETKTKLADSTIDKSREMIRQAVTSGQDVVVKVTPGAGKTHTTLIEILTECQKKTVVYAEPTKAKARELYDAALGLPNYQFDFNIPAVSLIEGRNKKNCQRYPEADRIAQKGFRPSVILCPECLHRNSCKYRKQFMALKRPGLVIMTHEQAALTKAKNASEIIFDENPETTLLKSESVTFDEAKRYRVGGGEPVKSFFLKIDRLLDQQADECTSTKRGSVIHSKAPDDQADIFTAAEITPDEIDAMRRQLAYYQPIPDETDKQYQNRLYRENVNLRALKWLLITIDEMPGRSSIKLSHKGRYTLEYTQKRKVEPAGRVIVLDGTAFPDALEKIFNRPFQLIQATVDLVGIKTVHFKRGFGKTKLSGMGQPEIERLLKRSLPELPPDGKKILICTWKNSESTVQAAAEKVFPGCEIQTIHFMQSRGLNQYQDHDTAIMFGTFTMNQVETSRRAEILFPGDPDTQNAYRLNLSNAENIQSIHRVRPIYGNKTLIVYGKQWIPDIPAPQVVSDLRPGGTDAIDEAYRRAEAFYLKHGFFYRHICWLLGFGHRTERDQVKAYSQVGNLEVLRLINNIILDETLLNCRHLYLNDRHYCDYIINKLHSKYPTAPILKTTQTSQGKTVSGIGKVNSVRKFLIRIGSLDQFDPDAWEEIQADPPKQQPDTWGAPVKNHAAGGGGFFIHGQRGPPFNQEGGVK